MTSAQMLRMFILNSAVKSQSSRKVSSISGTDIRDNIQKLGFGKDIALEILTGICSARYMFTTSHGPATYEASYFPSRLGGHVIRNLITSFVFLENTMMDTFIDKDDVWQELYALTDEIYNERNTLSKIRTRKKRVEIFYEFLENSYELLQAEAVRRGLPIEWQGNPFKDGRVSLSTNLEKVISSAERNYG